MKILERKKFVCHNGRNFRRVKQFGRFACFMPLDRCRGHFGGLPWWPKEDYSRTLKNYGNKYIEKLFEIQEIDENNSLPVREMVKRQQYDKQPHEEHKEAVLNCLLCYSRSKIMNLMLRGDLIWSNQSQHIPTLFHKTRHAIFCMLKSVDRDRLQEILNTLEIPAELISMLLADQSAVI